MRRAPTFPTIMNITFYLSVYILSRRLRFLRVNVRAFSKEILSFFCCFLSCWRLSFCKGELVLFVFRFHLTVTIVMLWSATSSTEVAINGFFTDSSFPLFLSSSWVISRTPLSASLVPSLFSWRFGSIASFELLPSKKEKDSYI